MSYISKKLLPIKSIESNLMRISHTPCFTVILWSTSSWGGNFWTHIWYWLGASLKCPQHQHCGKVWPWAEHGLQGTGEGATGGLDKWSVSQGTTHATRAPPWRTLEQVIFRHVREQPALRISSADCSIPPQTRGPVAESCPSTWFWWGLQPWRDWASYPGKTCSNPAGI